MGNSDKESLDRLVSAHLAGMLRFATRLAGNPDAAEEIVQDALVRAVRSWGSFRRDARATTWLMRIVINAFRDWAAKRPEQESLIADVADCRAVEPATQAMAEELGRLIASRVSALPPRQREVLVLITYEGLSPEEAAEVLGISPANVYANLHAARRRLRRSLASYLSEKCDEKRC